eukprot:tig00001239_g7764.t1
MAWVPDQQGLANILQLLKDSRSPNNAVHRQIQAQLESFNAIPDFNKYLCFILVHMKSEAEDIRQMAGLLLKNNVRGRYAQLNADVQNYIKEEVVKALGDPQHFIRSTVGTVIVTIATSAGFEAWPGLVQYLIGLLDSPDLYVIDGAFDALYKICEDMNEALDSDKLGRPLNVLIPKLLTFFPSPHENFRKQALGCINQFILVAPNALLVHMDSFLQGLFSLATDASAEVRKRVCMALVMLLEVRLDVLLPHIQNVIEYILHATQDADEYVALEACEFWSAFAETKVSHDILRPYMPRLIPVLLKGMVYSEIDATVLAAEDEDEMVPDREQDIKPRFYHPKAQAGGSHSADNANAAEEKADDDDDDDEDDDDDDDDDEEVSEWNLRKCSAAGLDILSGIFGDEILPILLPLIQERLASDKWDVRESAILALGAVAEGCIDGMQPHLPQLVPYLISLLQDSKPLVRSITCWTLSRFSKWVVHQSPAAEQARASNGQNQLLSLMMQELLKRVLDGNKKVQEAACSAFATLEEEAQHELVPYLQPILQNLMFAFTKYQAKNLLILYDAIGTLADSVGSDLNRPEYVAMLMPPLIVRWNQLSDVDKNLFPLLECLTSVAQALGPGFLEFADPVFQRCLRLVENTLRAQAMNEEGDKEFIVCALDLLSGLAEGLKAGIDPLVAKSNLTLLLFECAKDQAPDVRQSAFALVGDLAKSCHRHLQPHLKEFVPVLLQNLDPTYLSVCNNASWALGELAVKVGAEMRPYAAVVVEALVPLLNRAGGNKSLLENTAITLGRLGLVCPDDVAPHLARFVQPWCMSLRNIRDDVEKEDAFRGLVACIKINPQGVVPSFIYLCDAIASWYDLKPDLQAEFHQILYAFKSHAPEEWARIYGQFPEALKRALHERYQLQA